MNRSLLAELQQMRSYPSITVLMNTTRGAELSNDELATARRLTQTAAERLASDVSDDVRRGLISRLVELVDERGGRRNGHALAVCVSPEYNAAVSLGGSVDERVVIDETFATRDLVADLNRTAEYRVIAVSESAARNFLGDRGRIIEERSDIWPLTRPDDTSDEAWSREVGDQLAALDADNSIPVVVAGVKRTVTRLVDASATNVIGHVAGNHDRTNAAELHTLVWPIVLDWIGTEQQRAFARLDEARSAKRYVSGIDEIWSLANDGRVDLLVVEEGYALRAHIGAEGHLQTDHHADPRLADAMPADRAITDDIIDEVIEAVLRNGGTTTLVDNATLDDCGRIAAALRY
jgi:hypothetical protein